MEIRTLASLLDCGHVMVSPPDSLAAQWLEAFIFPFCISHMHPGLILIHTFV